MKLKFLFSFFGLFIFASSYAQMSNLGVLSVENGSTVVLSDDYLNETTGNFTNNGTFIVGGDYSNKGMIHKANGTTVFKSSTDTIQYVSDISGTVYFNKLEIDNSLKGVAIVDGTCLTVNQDILLREGTLKLIGQSELIQIGTGVNPNASINGFLDKEMSGVSSGYAYNYWSSPVHNNDSYKLEDVLYDGTDSQNNPFNEQQVDFTGSYDAVPSQLDEDGNVTTPMKISTYWFYTFIDNNYGYPGWLSISKSSAVNPGVGFTMKGSNSSTSKQNYVFKGTPNSGDYTVEIHSGNEYLIGNPYPSSLDADQLITDNINVFDEIYFWVDGGTNSHNLSSYKGGYATYNLVTGVPGTSPPPPGYVEVPDNIIAPGQGFFVRSDGGDTLIQFNNEQRIFGEKQSVLGIASKEASAEGQKSNKELKSIIRLGFKNSEGYVRQIVLGFVPNSNADLFYNRGYDSELFDVQPEDCYFVLKDKPEEKYIIQGAGEFQKDYEFPLGFQASDKKGQQFFVQAVENFNGAIYLKDNITGISYEISEEVFNLNLKKGVNDERYSLVFKPSTSNEKEEALKNALKVYFQEDAIAIENPYSLELEKIVVFNTIGQIIYESPINNEIRNDLTIPFRYSKGVYLIQVYTKSSAAIFKRLKK